MGGKAPWAGAGAPCSPRHPPQFGLLTGQPQCPGARVSAQRLARLGSSLLCPVSGGCREPVEAPPLVSCLSVLAALAQVSSGRREFGGF